MSELLSYLRHRSLISISFQTYFFYFWKIEISNNWKKKQQKFSKWNKIFISDKWNFQIIEAWIKGSLLYQQTLIQYLPCQLWRFWWQHPQQSEHIARGGDVWACWLRLEGWRWGCQSYGQRGMQTHDAHPVNRGRWVKM